MKYWCIIRMKCLVSVWWNLKCDIIIQYQNVSWNTVCSNWKVLHIEWNIIFPNIQAGLIQFSTNFQHGVFTDHTSKF